MKKIYFLFSFFAFLCSANAQQVLVDNHYSGFNDVKSCLKIGNGYMLLSSKKTATAQFIALILTNLNGDTLSVKLSGDNKKRYEPKALLHNPSLFSPYCVVGTVYDSLNSGNQIIGAANVFIATYGPDGSFLKMNVYPYAQFREVVGQAIMASNDEVIITGTTLQGLLPLFAMRVKVTNYTFTTVWRKDYNLMSNYFEGALHSLIANKGGFMFDYDAAVGFDLGVGVAQISNDGTLKWDSKYYLYKPVGSDGLTESVGSITAINNNRFLMMGTSQCISGLFKPQPFTFICIDSLGQLVSKKSYGDSLQKQNWIANGQTINNGAGTITQAGYCVINSVKKAFVMEFSETGDTLSIKYFNNQNDNISGFNGLAADGSGGLIYYGGAANRGWLIKNKTTIVTGINEFGINDNVLKIYPNPVTNGELKIEHAEWINKVEIYNVLGERVFTSTISTASTSSATAPIAIPLQGLRKGIYFVKLFGNGEPVVRKIVID